MGSPICFWPALAPAPSGPPSTGFCQIIVETSFRCYSVLVLIDSFGRKLDYLRVSVTDRCNLRCVYCMPPEGVEWKPHGSMLRFEETLRLCRIMAELGIRKIRVTGGEPLLLKGLALFIKNLKGLPGIERLSLTSNGFLLAAYLDEAEALSPGSLPDGVNLSLDALDPRSFSRISRDSKHRPEEILSHIDRLLEKHVQVKINCVPVRGFNEEEIAPLAGLARDRNIAVRFIELMPLGPGSELKPIPGSETAAIIEKAHGRLMPLVGIGTKGPGTEASGPAVYYSLPGFAGKIGFINPMSQGFCEACNRLRLTADGLLKPCLSDALARDLKELLRAGASDSEIAEAIVETIAKKPKFHKLSPVYGTLPAESEGPHPDGMFGIGG